MKGDLGQLTKRAYRNRLRVFRSRVLRWFDLQGRQLPWRQPDQSAYRMIVCELLLQRTRAESVAKIYSTFFDAYPSWVSLSHAQRSELVPILRPLGLWRRRVEVIMELAQALQKRHGMLPPTRRDIEELPGVGQYIANAIELIGFGTPRPLLDVNMARVLERYFGPRNLADIRYDPYLQDLAQGVVECEESLSLNWAVLDLGAMVCTTRSPQCPVCPLRLGCKCARGISCARDDFKFLAAPGELAR